MAKGLLQQVRMAFLVKYFEKEYTGEDFSFICDKCNELTMYSASDEGREKFLCLSD
jgi:formylmethanofuran dehydrogenase subunit E